MAYQYNPVVLVIFDGWGVAPPNPSNAITSARLPNFQNYLRHYPAMTLHASGPEVGLGYGEIGNSEVGHLNMGAGRVYYQSAPRISQAILDESFFSNPAITKAVEHARKNNSNLHLIAMLTSSNVHASNDHLYAMLELCKKEKLGKQVFIHVILDGRDSTYNSGATLVAELEKKLHTLKVGTIASLSGRFYAMDRDNRWERVGAAYRAMAVGESPHQAEDALSAIEASYKEKVYDEEFVPTVIAKRGKPIGPVRDGDAAIFLNFRPDRARELTKAFVLPGFNKFERPALKDLLFVTLMEYEKDLPALVAFQPLVVKNCLAEVVATAGLKQFHVAETEKYAHVTFFLNGTLEEPFAGETRKLIPSPHVSSYAEVPAMSAVEVSKEAVKAITSGQYNLVVVNFANADMVGHTGNLPAAIKACEVLDGCLKNIIEHTLSQGGVAVITADHGNAEEMVNLQTGAIDKEHSINPVPCIIVGKEFQGRAGAGGDPPEGDLSLLPPVGVLSDVAPTVLALMGLPQPPEMTGTPLI
jgi:2,3-bisphosphoglycerate-independent phosphoglycerate mutase